MVAVEQTANSKPLTEYQFESKTLLIVGNEQNGIDAEVLSTTPSSRIHSHREYIYIYILILILISMKERQRLCGFVFEYLT